jgi:hypothetical protein
MQLKDTVEGKAWIRQFEQGDQKDAVFLLESLRLVSDNRFHGDIRRAVTKTAEGLGDNIALYAVREVDDDEQYFENKSKRPVAVKRGKVGSEGAMSRIITGLERGNPKRYINHPPLRSMKAKKTRHIMLLDDLVGSGNRIVEFIQSLRRHKTLVSWCSNHFIRFHIVAYSISEEAEGIIRTAFGPGKGDWPRVKISFAYAKRPNVVAGRWAPSDLERMRTLCSKYGEMAKIRWGNRLGYRQSMAALVFSHGCPNNVPGILWTSTDAWTALFPNRAVSDALLAQVFSQPLAPAAPVAAVAASPLSGGLDEGDPVRADVIRLLALLRRRIRGTPRLAEILDVTTFYCDDLFGICRQYRLIDDNGLLTDSGRTELQRAERADKLVEENATEPRPFYVPTQLREARGNV